MRDIGRLARLCAETGQKLCITGAYIGKDVAATLLGERKIAATIGYSERLAVYPATVAFSS